MCWKVEDGRKIRKELVNSWKFKDILYLLKPKKILVPKTNNYPQLKGSVTRFCKPTFWEEKYSFWESFDIQGIANICHKREPSVA